MTAASSGALLGPAGIAALAAWVLVGLVRSYSIRRAVLDHPTDRSSHSVPTPRGGGLGLILAFLVAFGVSAFSEGIDWRVGVALGGVVFTAIVGWLDDHAGLPVGARLAAHIAAGLTLLPLALTPDPVPSWLGPAAVLWWILWTVSAINVVNFMDGIDGIIGLQALVFGVHLALLGGDGGLARSFGLALAGAALGFLLWNWAPAKIFLGDVGSGSLGIAMVLGGLLLLRETRVSLAVAYLPLYPIFLDAAVTLVRRARQREKLTAAHRSHLYQRLANGRWRHARVSVLYGACSVLAALLVQIAPPQGATLGTYFVLVAALGWVLERNQKQVSEDGSGWPPHPTP